MAAAKIRAAMLACILLAGCAGEVGYICAPKRESMQDVQGPEESAAFNALASAKGPVRFARVSDGLYRGGQPTMQHLQDLYALGVRTIVNLRREDSSVWREEERQAKRLGIQFLHFPFYGVFGVDDLFLNGIVEQIKKGKVYVHCLHGRDRTSLMVALYRVLVEGWEPKVAWKLEAIDYGSAQTFWYRPLRNAFERMVVKYPPPTEPPPQPPSVVPATVTPPAPSTVAVPKAEADAAAKP